MTAGANNQAQMSDLKPKEGEVIRSGDVVPMDSTAGLIAAGELDQQITTARKYPRSVEMFRREAMDLACLNEAVAAECLFGLRRENADGTVKVIEGPSIRLAEIIAYTWGNCRIGSRIVLEGAETVVTQGVFQDVQRNVVMTSEVSRSILNKRGRRYSRDMITVTTNAAQAIAKRNAITSGVPRALWWDVYQQARKVAAGDAKSLSTKIREAINAFSIYGVTLEQILAVLHRKGESEITRDDVILLLGIYRAIKDEETTIEEAFPPDTAEKKSTPEGADTGASTTTAATPTSDGGSRDAPVATTTGPQGDGGSAATQQSDAAAGADTAEITVVRKGARKVKDIE